MYWYPQYVNSLVEFFKSLKLLTRTLTYIRNDFQNRLFDDCIDWVDLSSRVLQFIRLKVKEMRKKVSLCQECSRMCRWKGIKHFVAFDLYNWDDEEEEKFSFILTAFLLNLKIINEFLPDGVWVMNMIREQKDICSFRLINENKFQQTLQQRILQVPLHNCSFNNVKSSSSTLQNCKSLESINWKFMKFIDNCRSKKMHSGIKLIKFMAKLFTF